MEYGSLSMIMQHVTKKKSPQTGFINMVMSSLVFPVRSESSRTSVGCGRTGERASLQHGPESERNVFQHLVESKPQRNEALHGISIVCLIKRCSVSVCTQPDLCNLLRNDTGCILWLRPVFFTNRVRIWRFFHLWIARQGFSIQDKFGSGYNLWGNNTSEKQNLTHFIFSFVPYSIKKSWRYQRDNTLSLIPNGKTWGSR